jgi:MoaA/NifB/PqqE/SkfB family radical SAM enzyme
MSFLKQLAVAPGRLGVTALRAMSSIRSERVLAYVDTANPEIIGGWAVDVAQPERKLKIEIRSGGSVLLETSTGIERRDLEPHFPRAVYSGFRIETLTIPHTKPTIECSVHVEGLERPVKSVVIERVPFLKFLALDVVNTCNLRCPFCLVDYSQARKTEPMDADIFRRLLPLAEFVPEGGFFVSCLHEPTLHPQFEQLLGMVPRHLGKKFFFTTNLARPLSDETFHAWASSGIRHINISFDSMNADLVAVLRKFAKWEIFEDNLTRLAAVFRTYADAPKIRYITMAFQSNMGEIPNIVRRCHEDFLGVENEIRYTFDFGHINDDFRRKEYMRKEHWDILTQALQSVPYRYLITYPPMDTSGDIIDIVHPSATYLGIRRTATEWIGPRQQWPIALRVRSDGTVMAVGAEDHWAVNMHDVDEDPVNLLCRIAGQAAGLK